MRIAFVTLGFAPFRASGLDVSGERLVHGLLEAGHHVTVIAGARGSIVETWTHPSLEVYRVRIGRSNWIGFAVRASQLLRRLIGRQSFDTVHFWDVHFAFAYSGSYVASLQHSFRQRWSIWQQGGDYLPLLAYRFTYYELARLLAEMPSVRRAHGLLAGSIATRDEFIQHYGILSERIALARHGIDVDFFCPGSSKKKIRSELGLGPNDPVILFVGFVTPRKGLDYLARALPMIRPAPYLIVVGHWSEGYRAHFLGLLGPMASRVIEAGFVPDEQMPTYYSMADVYVSTSLLEGFGLTLAESLACETPVVAVDGGATAEVVGPGGIIIPPRDSIAVANAVSTLLQDPSLRDRLGKDGREHIKREFTVQKMVGDTLRAYEGFLEAPSTLTI